MEFIEVNNHKKKFQIYIYRQEFIAVHVIVDNRDLQIE